jgi:aspartyl-tRNA synthetase
MSEKQLGFQVGYTQNETWRGYFIDLRDHYGITQIVVNPERPFFPEVESVRNESVITIDGTVVARSQETINPNIGTGEIEVVADNYILESACEQLPFPINKDVETSEELRLEYRFLDLRKNALHKNIILRSKLAQL